MQEAFRVERANLRRDRNVAEITDFLRRFDLDFDADVEVTLALRDQDGTLVGTGSAKGEVLRNIAVDEAMQGAGLTATILSSLMQEMARKGVMHYFIFTRPAKAFLFESLGFSEIARAEPYAALLENGLGSVAAYCDAVVAETENLPANRAAMVINANPFTLGHQALVAKAAAECPGVIVFVVSEDRSLFPYADRLRLVREGLAHLANVAVVEGGKYIISAATFPTYFTREHDHANAQTRLDCALFARQIAPRLGITRRYAGEEPYCRVTAEYNAAMREILPDAGIAVHTMPRVAVDGEVVSASRVRELLRVNDWPRLEKLLPPTTLDYLRSEEGRTLLEERMRLFNVDLLQG